jgi:hypothetical protein
MFSTIKTYAIAILALIAAIATALMYRSKAKYEGAMRKGVEQVRETEKKAQNAIDTGRKREKEARSEAKSAIANRTFFG